MSSSCKIIVYEAPFDEAFLAEFSSIAAEVFQSIEPVELRWRLENMPRVSVQLAYVEEMVDVKAGEKSQPSQPSQPLKQQTKIAGFKAGYAATHSRYYSWLGGVSPDHRQSGIALALMKEQHRWVKKHGFALVDTHVSQKNAAMMALNKRCGFAVIGSFNKVDDAYFIMQKKIAVSPGT